MFIIYKQDILIINLHKLTLKLLLSYKSTTQIQFYI